MPSRPDVRRIPAVALLLAASVLLSRVLGYVREAGVTGVGVAFSVGGGPTWNHPNGFWVSLRGRYTRSQRATVYSSSSASIALGRGF